MLWDTFIPLKNESSWRRSSFFSISSPNSSLGSLSIIFLEKKWATKKAWLYLMKKYFLWSGKNWWGLTGSRISCVLYYFEGFSDKIGSQRRMVMEKEPLTWQKSTMPDSYRPIYLPFRNHGGKDNAYITITNVNIRPERPAWSLELWEVSEYIFGPKNGEAIIVFLLAHRIWHRVDYVCYKALSKIVSVYLENRREVKLAIWWTVGNILTKLILFVNFVGVTSMLGR